MTGRVRTGYFVLGNVVSPINLTCIFLCFGDTEAPCTDCNHCLYRVPEYGPVTHIRTAQSVLYPVREKSLRYMLLMEICLWLVVLLLNLEPILHEVLVWLGLFHSLVLLLPTRDPQVHLHLVFPPVLPSNPFRDPDGTETAAVSPHYWSVTEFHAQFINRDLMIYTAAHQYRNPFTFCTVRIGFSGTVEGNWMSQRKPLQAQGKHANSSQKGPPRIGTESVTFFAMRQPCYPPNHGAFF